MAGATYGAFEGLAKGTYGLFKVKFCIALSIVIVPPPALGLE